ncbi:MAG: hypothetical protein EXS09_01220 [Gemmataceae bacterium]|nr:hypothetical protein [Gemmataceae bacterium]
MFRNILTALALGFLSSVGLAESYIEKLTEVDNTKKTVTFAVDGKPKTFKVDEKVDVLNQVFAGKRLRVIPVKEGLKGVKTGIEAAITTEKKDGVEVVTKIVILPKPKGN